MSLSSKPQCIMLYEELIVIYRSSEAATTYDQSFLYPTLLCYPYAAYSFVKARDSLSVASHTTARMGRPTTRSAIALSTLIGFSVNGEQIISSSTTNIFVFAAADNGVSLIGLLIVIALATTGPFNNQSMTSSQIPTPTCLLPSSSTIVPFLSSLVATNFIPLTK